MLGASLLSILRQLPSGLLLSSLVLATNALPVESAEVELTVLTPDNFDSTVAQGAWFIEHFSPYCHHCKAFMPTWEKLVQHYESMDDPGVHLAQVNCAVNGDLCDKHGVTGYPQMMMYKNGEAIEKFKGRRDWDLLTEFIEKHAEHGEPKTEVEPITDTQQPEIVNEKVPNEDGIVRAVDSAGFKALLDEGPAFVKFYAPWCGHCKKLAPIWAQLAAVTKGKLNIAEVNCEIHKDVCQSQHVQGYPTLFYYTGGSGDSMHKTEYNGGRRLDQMQNFAEMAVAPPVREVKTDSDYEYYVKESPILYLFLHNKNNKIALDLLTSTSRILLGSPLILTSTDSNLRSRFHVPDQPVLLAIKDGNPYTYSSAFYLPASEIQATADVSVNLSAWLLRHRLPSALELTQDTFQEVMNAPHRPLVAIIAYNPEDNARAGDVGKAAAASWRMRVAEKTKLGERDVVFTWMDAKKWAKWMKSMYGVKADGLPAVVVADHHKLVYYDTDTKGAKIQLDRTSIVNAVEGIFEGKVSYKNSENIFERTARRVNNGIQWLEECIVSHPYRSGLFFIGFIVALFYVITRFLGDDMPSSSGDYSRLQKSRVA